MKCKTDVTVHILLDFSNVVTRYNCLSLLLNN